MRTNQVGHLGEDANDFPRNFGFGLTDAVIGLDNRLGLDKHRFSGSTLIMHNAVKFALIHGIHRQHQTAITQRGLNIIVQNAVLLALGDNPSQSSIDAAGHTGNRDAQFMKFWRGGGLDVASLVQYATDGNAHLGERLHTIGEFAQTGIGRVSLSVGREETHHLGYCHQQTLQVKQTLGREKCAWCSDFLEHNAQVKIVTERELPARLHDRQEFIGLFEPSHHLVALRRETQPRHIGGPQRAHTMTLQLTTHCVEANLILKT